MKGVAEAAGLMADGAMPKKKPVPRGGASSSPTEAYYRQLGLFPLRIRVPQSTLDMLDDLVPVSKNGTKAKAVEEAIAFAHRALTKKK